MSIRKYRDWTIETEGGHITIKRFLAEKENKRHWAFTLHECKKFCDQRDNEEEIEGLYLKPLYL